MTETPTVEDVRRWLTELPDLCALLPDALVVRTPHGEGSRGVPGPKPPARLGVLHLLDERTKDVQDSSCYPDYPDPDRVGVLPYLDTWARDLEATALDERPELPDELPEHPTVANICGWLLGELEWASTLPQWPELADGCGRLWKAVRIATRAVRDRDERPVPCSRCGAGRLERVEGEKPLWECRACGHLISVRAVTLGQAAKIIGVHREQLKRWSMRQGLLSPISDTPGRRLYDLGELQRLVAEHRLRRADDDSATA